jgi:hypothetical protein
MRIRIRIRILLITLMRIRIQLLTLMRIRSLPFYFMRVQADPDPQHPLLKSPLFPVSYLMLVWLLALKWWQTQKMLSHLPGRGRWGVGRHSSARAPSAAQPPRNLHHEISCSFIFYKTNEIFATKNRYSHNYQNCCIALQKSMQTNAFKAGYSKLAQKTTLASNTKKKLKTRNIHFQLFQASLEGLFIKVA